MLYLEILNQVSCKYSSRTGYHDKFLRLLQIMEISKDGVVSAILSKFSVSEKRKEYLTEKYFIVNHTYLHIDKGVTESEKDYRFSLSNSLNHVDKCYFLFDLADSDEIKHSNKIKVYVDNLHSKPLILETSKFCDWFVKEINNYNQQNMKDLEEKSLRNIFKF